MQNKNSVQKNLKRSKLRLWHKILIILGLLFLLAIGIYNIPAVKVKLSWRISNLRSSLLYLVKPPEQAAFNPTQQQEMAGLVADTLTAMVPTATPTPTITPTKLIPPTPTQTPIPTITPTPVPEQIQLEGVKREFQGFNNCGPTNLSMALSFWGWKGNQYSISKILKPNERDRNVMPYELVDYVTNNTEFSAVLRYGGDLEVIKRLIAGGFPVLIERGLDVPGRGWMGHYGVVTGYDDAAQRYSTPDSYFDTLEYLSYEEFFSYWGHFDYLYIVIFPAVRESEVMAILGPHADEAYNLTKAAEESANRIYNVTGRGLFFAWYSRGSILVQMDDYYGAALAYDEAFRLYDELPEDKATRPWRVTWYQTGPYFAYYFTGRYYDVISLADWTLEGQQLWGFDIEPGFEETWVWRGRAKLALGDTTGAIEDFRSALIWHPDWWVAIDELKALGVTP